MYEQLKFIIMLLIIGGLYCGIYIKTNIQGQQEIKQHIQEFKTETNSRIDKPERQLPSMEKRIIGELNLQGNYIFDDM